MTRTDFMNRRQRRQREQAHRRDLRGSPGAITASWTPVEEIEALMPIAGQRIVAYEEQGPNLLCYAHFDGAKAMFTIDEAAGRDWFHVSISAGKAPVVTLPSWHQLKLARELFFQEEVVVVQVFPPASEWFSFGDVLHLWQRLGPGRLVPDLRKKGGL